MERVTGFEPATARLEIWNSTNWATPAWFETRRYVRKENTNESCNMKTISLEFSFYRQFAVCV